MPSSNKPRKPYQWELWQELLRTIERGAIPAGALRPELAEAARELERENLIKKGGDGLYRMVAPVDRPAVQWPPTRPSRRGGKR